MNEQDTTKNTSQKQDTNDSGNTSNGKNPELPVVTG